MSSGKADVNFPIEILEKSLTSNIPQEPIFEHLDIDSLESISFDYKLTKFYGKIINIHFFLANNKHLTNREKLDYCTLERYFMKLYLKEMMKRR